MRWTPQAHYQVPGGKPADTRRGYWENNPDPEPEAEPAGPDAATWAATVVAAQSDAAAEAVAVVLKAHTELAERLKGPEMLEGTTEGVDTIAWKLPGLEQTAPAALKAGEHFSRMYRDKWVSQRCLPRRISHESVASGAFAIRRHVDVPLL